MQERFTLNFKLNFFAERIIQRRTMIPCCIVELVQWALVLVLIAFVALCIFVILTSEAWPKLETFEQEKTFKTSKSDTELKVFPSLGDPGSVDLSVIVPAYNETLRLPKMLDECLEFLANLVEVIVITYSDD